LDFDPDRVKKFYKEKFEKGKDVAKEWSEELKDTAEDVAQKGSIIVDEITDTASDIISEMNPDEVKESMENVKATANEVPPSSSSETPASEFIKKAFESDPLAKLKELGELKAAGVITEEEFQTMKKKIIDDF
jgi:gas vesicle protein